MKHEGSPLSPRERLALFGNWERFAHSNAIHTRASVERSLRAVVTVSEPVLVIATRHGIARLGEMAYPRPLRSWQAPDPDGWPRESMVDLADERRKIDAILGRASKEWNEGGARRFLAREPMRYTAGFDGEVYIRCASCGDVHREQGGHECGIESP